MECSKIFLTLEFGAGWFPCALAFGCSPVKDILVESTRSVVGLKILKYVTPRISRMVTGPVQTYNLY